MKIDCPAPELVPQLRALWKEAFGDTDAFLDLFFGTAFDPGHCRCIQTQGRVTAALYWLDFHLEGRKFAYIYAVATGKDCRGQGLCTRLMADTAAHLRKEGYHTALLVPQDAGLRAMYGRMGYLDTGRIDVFFCAAGDTPVPIRKITAAEYANARRQAAPAGSPQPGNRAVAFLETLADLYEGSSFLAAVSNETEHLRILEYLGDRKDLPGLIAALGATEATVRAPGDTAPFAMFLPLGEEQNVTEYFALAFD